MFRYRGTSTENIGAQKMNKKIIIFIMSFICIVETSLSQTKTANDLITSAYSKYGRNNYQGSINDYTKAIALSPNYAIAYIGRGLVRHKIKDYQGAIEDYTKAIELNPKYPTTYSKRGLVNVDLKDYQAAISDYTKAIELKPKYAEAYKNRGLSYLGLEQKSNALADFMKAKELGYTVPRKLLDMCK